MTAPIHGVDVSESATPTGRHSDRHGRKPLLIEATRPNKSGSASLSRGDLGYSRSASAATTESPRAPIRASAATGGAA